MKIYGSVLVLLTFLVVGCGQNSSTNVYSVNSPYIDLSQSFNMPNYSNTIYLFNEGTSSLDNLSQEEILFHHSIRPTVVKFGHLDSNLLGLTECLYSNDGTSSCTITISNIINPDVDPSATNTFRGVLKHELGHAFGLGHIKDDDNNVMYPIFYDKQTSQENLYKFVINLTNFRKNGTASGLPPITTK
jgi:hypothetical protein